MLIHPSRRVSGISVPEMLPAASITIPGPTPRSPHHLPIVVMPTSSSVPSLEFPHPRDGSAVLFLPSVAVPAKAGGEVPDHFIPCYSCLAYLNSFSSRSLQ